MIRPPFRFPAGKKELALLLAGGAILGGKYLWNKWKESKNMQPQKNYPTSTSASDDPSPFGTMQSNSGKSISLKSVSLTGSVKGLLFSSIIRQEYKNETDEALEIIYTFPVGYNTLLLGMDATIGDKKLHGEVVKKAEAEEKYEKAIDKGDSAIMLQQSSLGLYTANLGNIKPQETVTVEIHCAKLLNYDQGQIRVAIPTVIGERYGDEHCAGGLSAHETAKPDKNARYAFSLSLCLKGDICKGIVECPTHQAQMEKNENSISVKLDSNAYLDRDFVLLIKGLSGESHALCAADEEKWMTCASFCPHMENVDDNPLGLKILVDCSGSMSGMSIKQAQKGLQKILQVLSPKDYVSYSCFGSDVRHLTNSMLQCTSDNMQKLFAVIDATDANMGGTEMERAVLSTIKDIKNNGDVPPVLLVITDGDVWEIKSLIESAKKSGHRIFVIGVGAAPAESVLYELAQQTGGACEFITPNENMAESIVRMFHRMRGNTAKNIHIDWNEKPVWQAELPKFIYDGETVHTFALFDKKPEHGPTLSWFAGDKEYTDRIDNIEESQNSDLVRLARRCQMLESQTESEKLDIALKYRLVSDLTSLILVYERPEDEKIKGLPKIQQVPQMRAYGHGNYTASSAFCASAIGCMTENIIAPGLIGNHVVRPPMPSIWEIGKRLFAKRIDPFELRIFLAEISALWQSRLFQINSLQDFITDIEGEKKYESVIKFLKELAKNIGIPKEALYAAIIEMMLQEAGEPDRHSLRLLIPHFPDEKKKLQIIHNIKQAMQALPGFGPLICN